jgi:hypothetical protein
VSEQAFPCFCMCCAVLCWPTGRTRPGGLAAACAG